MADDADQQPGGDTPVSFSEGNPDSAATAASSKGKKKGAKSKGGKSKTSKGGKSKKSKGGKSKGGKGASENSQEDEKKGKKGGKKKGKKEKKKKTAHFKKRGNPMFKIMCLVFTAISVVCLIGAIVCGILLATHAV